MHLTSSGPFRISAPQFRATRRVIAKMFQEISLLLERDQMRSQWNQLIFSLRSGGSFPHLTFLDSFDIWYRRKQGSRWHFWTKCWWSISIQQESDYVRVI